MIFLEFDETCWKWFMNPSIWVSLEHITFLWKNVFLNEQYLNNLIKMLDKHKDFQWFFLKKKCVKMLSTYLLYVAKSSTCTNNTRSSNIWISFLNNYIYSLMGRVSSLSCIRTRLVFYYPKIGRLGFYAILEVLLPKNYKITVP